MRKLQFQFIPYIIPLFISAIITFGLGLYGIKHRFVRGAKAFAISMFIGTLWTTANALEMAGTDFITKIVWANIQYIAYGFAPVAWLMMVLQFSDRSDWVTKKNIILVSIIPLITIILVWTDSLFGLVRYNFHLDYTGAFPVIAKSYGYWFWVHYLYSYLINFLTVILLFRIVFSTQTIYRKQAFYLLTGHMVIVLTNILYVSGLSPFKFDLSPISISISGVIMAWGIFHYRTFDLIPVARATVIEKMGTGIIVTDKQNRVIDINPQAREMLHLSEGIKIGQPLRVINEKLEKLIAFSRQNELTSKEFVFKYDNKYFYYELYTSAIYDSRQNLNARVLILNDITDLKRAREQVNVQLKELAVMGERNRMARELHDNLGQIMSFANVQIQAVRQHLKKNEIELADNYLMRLNSIINDAHKEIREYVYNIRDNDSYKDNLFNLIQKQTAEFKNHSNIEINLRKSIDYTIKPNLSNSLGIEEKMQLLNITREALTNILKHAAASTINIFLIFDSVAMKLIIEDDGKGIENQERKIASGLNIMYERARLIGGQLTIESQSGIGTKIMLTLPGQFGGEHLEDYDSR